jgi:hypothetical protein
LPVVVGDRVCPTFTLEWHAPGKTSALMRLLLATATLLAACTTSNRVSIHQAGPLRTGNHRDVFDAGSARVGPHSKLRFCRDAEGCSDWIRAADLRVDDAGAWLGSSREGYAWSDVTRVDVKDFDRLKTTGAILGTTAAVAVVVPAVLLASSLRTVPRGDKPHVRRYPEATAAVVVASVAAEAATAPEQPDATPYWPPSARTDLDAPRLFTRGARARSVVSVGAVVDASASIDGDLVTSGGVARLRFGDYVELGAGARVARGKGDDGTWHTSRWYVAQGSFHAPITARFALPIGLDIAWGGARALSNQVTIPWGLRYTSTSGRWFGTLNPVSPAWVKRDGNWRLGVVSGVGIGIAL